MNEKRIILYAFVIMPNHLHLIWQIQAGHKRENVQRDFLKCTAQKIKYDFIENHPGILAQSGVKAKDRAYQFWERNLLNVDLYNHQTFMQKLIYMHRNPVQERWRLSKLVDYLLDEGFENITVLDISAKALEKAKSCLGSKGQKVNWVVSDITEFKSDTTFDVWHDRATFHFLTTSRQVAKYVDTARKYVNGYLTIGTFSQNGPRKCSGLDVKQYSEEALTSELQKGFDKIRCITEDHITPLKQRRIFCFAVSDDIQTDEGKGYAANLGFKKVGLLF